MELYDPETGTWTRQPNLPQDIIYPGLPYMIPFEQTILALFGEEKQIYQRAENGTWHVREGAVLPQPQFLSWYSATLVPEEFVNGCM